MKPDILQRALLRRLMASVPCALVLFLVALSPFAAALEVHHTLAAADHDGHEHSDSDLCQWVQHHTGASVLSGPPPVVSPFHAGQHHGPALALFARDGATSTGPPRGPPLS